MTDQNKEKVYGPFQLLAAHSEPPPQSFLVRRRLAAAMRALSEKLIRTDASDDELAQWAQTMEDVLKQAAGHDRRDTRAANKKLFTGQANASDVFDMMDYDPMGGLANPISPELRWEKVSPEGVEAKVYLGQQYQGPPGRVHGGVLSWIMDAVLARAMHASMRIGVTGTLNIRYMASTPIESEITCRASITRTEGRKLIIEGGVYHQDVQTVHVEGIWIQPAFAAS